MPGDESNQESTEHTFAKQQLGAKSQETKLLGIAWDKKEDSLAVCFPKIATESTKRSLLKGLASVYDPLGIVSPVMLKGKLIFRDACDAGLSWDEELPKELKR